MKTIFKKTIAYVSISTSCLCPEADNMTFSLKEQHKIENEASTFPGNLVFAFLLLSWSMVSNNCGITE